MILLFSSPSWLTKDSQTILCLDGNYPTPCLSDKVGPIQTCCASTDISSLECVRAFAAPVFEQLYPPPWMKNTTGILAFGSIGPETCTLNARKVSYVLQEDQIALTSRTDNLRYLRSRPVYAHWKIDHGRASSFGYRILQTDMLVVAQLLVALPRSAYLVVQPAFGSGACLKYENQFSSIV